MDPGSTLWFWIPHWSHIAFLKIHSPPSNLETRINTSRCLWNRKKNTGKNICLQWGGEGTPLLWWSAWCLSLSQDQSKINFTNWIGTLDDKRLTQPSWSNFKSLQVSAVPAVLMLKKTWQQIRAKQKKLYLFCVTMRIWVHANATTIWQSMLTNIDAIIFFPCHKK